MNDGTSKQRATTVPATRRGRPTLSRVGEIDRAILSAAQGLFLSQGFADTSMEAVAAEAGISKGTLYARYSTKQALFEAIAADRLQAWSLQAPGPSAAIGSLEARLLKRARSILDGISIPEVQAFGRLLTAEAKRFPELARDFYDRGFRSAVEHTRDDLVEALGPNWPETLDPAAVASIFCAGLIGWYRIEAAARDVKKAERDVFARQMVAFCLRALHPS